MARERTADRDGKKTILSGMDSVSSMIPLATSYDAPEASDWQLIGIKNVIDSAVEAGVGHFVLFSANSANWALNHNLANKFQMEEYARDKRLRSTLLRPVAYMENFTRPQWGLHQQVFTTALLPTTRQPLIAVDDIAEFAAIAVDHPPRAGSSILELAGDELTSAEMAAALSEALGRPIPCLYISTDTLLRLNEESAKGYAQINAGEMNPVDISALRQIHPGLMSFKTWLAAIGAAALRPLLPLDRPGAYLADLPLGTWKASLEDGCNATDRLTKEVRKLRPKSVISIPPVLSV
jgi:uncharacterized protein YbjT (DUF2867 family)